MLAPLVTLFHKVTAEVKPNIMIGTVDLDADSSWWSSLPAAVRTYLDLSFSSCHGWRRFFPRIKTFVRFPEPARSVAFRIRTQGDIILDIMHRLDRFISATWKDALKFWLTDRA